MGNEAARAFVKTDWTAHEALDGYRQILAHLYCWGDPQYEQFDEESKADFRRLVANPTEGFGCFEEGKRACLFLGVNMREVWLALPFPSEIKEGAPLPEVRRREISQIHDQVWAELCRLDVAEERARQNRTGDADDRSKSKRPAYYRDREWLKWKEDESSETHKSPAKIKAKWNSLSQDERRKICPQLFDKIEDGPEGTATVNKGIQTAKKERAKT